MSLFPFKYWWRGFCFYRPFLITITLWLQCVLVNATYTPFNVIKILISMIDTHRKDSGLKLAFCATTRIFPKERKLLNVTLFVPLACISNFWGCDFVLVFFKRQVERFKCGASRTFRVMCFSSFYYYRVTLLSYGHYLYYLYKGSQVFSWEVNELLWNLLAVPSFDRFGGINCVHSLAS